MIRPITLAMSLVLMMGQACAEPDPRVEKPDDVHVGLCGRDAPSEQTFLRRIFNHQQRFGGTESTAAYFRAMRPKAKLTISERDSTVNIEGVIGKSTPVALAAALKRWPELSRIRVNSLGGDAASGMAVARQLQGTGIELRVGAYCMSACANYLIPSARKVVFEDSIVGFHGSPSTCYDEHGWIGAVRIWGLSRTQMLRRTAAADRAFMEEHPGVAESVRLSHRVDRGAMDGKPRDWMIASPALLGAIARVDGPVTLGGHYARLISDLDEGLLGPITVHPGSR